MEYLEDPECPAGKMNRKGKTERKKGAGGREEDKENERTCGGKEGGGKEKESEEERETRTDER